MNDRIALITGALRLISLVLLPVTVLAQTISPAVKEAVLVGEAINIRSGPGKGYRPIVQLDGGYRLVVMQTIPNWVKVRLHDGVTGWTSPKYIRLVSPPAPVKPAAAPVKPVAAPVKPVAAPVKPVAAPVKPVAAPVKPGSEAYLNGTKQDPADRPQDSPVAATGEGLKLFLYLIPILGLVYLCIRFLREWYRRNGSLPNLKLGFLGSVNLLKARESGGSNIRVIESTPIGSVGLHLVEVRGKTFLLGSTASDVRMLADLTQTESPDSDFRTALREAGDEIGSDADDVAEVVDTLDDALRSTRETVSRLQKKGKEGAK